MVCQTTKCRGIRWYAEAIPRTHAHAHTHTHELTMKHRERDAHRHAHAQLHDLRSSCTL